MKEVYIIASLKLTALFRYKNYLEPEERKLISNSMIKSQFTYCPLRWMFCTKTLNNLVYTHKEPEERKSIFNSMIKSQFTYCPIVWMFCTRTLNNLIFTHKCFLRLILNDRESSFVELHRGNSDVANRQGSIQILLKPGFQ